MDAQTAARLTEETHELMLKAQQSPNGELLKAWVQSNSAISGITAYDLEAPSKKLYPVITPLRNEIPRVGANGGIQANWRAVTGVNTTQALPYASEGNRSGVITATTADYTAAYKGLGLEDTVTFEADYAATGFEDAKALAVEGLLRAMMIAEEKVILGGNNSLSLANTPTPTVASANTGGTLTGNAGFGVGCVALTFEGYMMASISGGVVQSVARTNADASSDTINGGAALKSTQANMINANTGNTVSYTASVTAVTGAYAYAWYWGANSGNLSLGAITTINSVLITANATGTQAFAALTSTNNSTNSLAFDGLLTMASKTALNPYIAVQATGNAGTGTPLTADGTGGITEIETALKYFWDTWRLSPDEMWVNSQEQKNISAKIATTSSSNPGAQRFTFVSDVGKITGGAVVVRSYLNKYGMNGNQEIAIRLHPNMPPGTILFLTKRLPYPLSNVTNVMQMRLRREYYQIEWPTTSRKYQYGVYEDGVLQHYAPFSMGIITNIANG